jgi:hypothetical protein
MGEVMSKRARLRAIRHLLEYALAEVHELGLRQLEQLLTAATATVNEELKGRSRAAAANGPRRPQIRLVEDVEDYAKGNATKV